MKRGGILYLQKLKSWRRIKIVCESNMSEDIFNIENQKNRKTLQRKKLLVESSPNST